MSVSRTAARPESSDPSLADACRALAKRARGAARILATVRSGLKNEWLQRRCRNLDLPHGPDPGRQRPGSGRRPAIRTVVVGNRSPETHARSNPERCRRRPGRGGAARSGRPGARQQRAAQWAAGPQGRRAARRHLLHLRIAAQRHGRRRRPVRQERQRHHPARRQGSAALQPCLHRLLQDVPRAGGLAARRGPARDHAGPGRGRPPAAAGRLHRPGDSRAAARA